MQIAAQVLLPYITGTETHVLAKMNMRAQILDDISINSMVIHIIIINLNFNF